MKIKHTFTTKLQSPDAYIYGLDKDLDSLTVTVKWSVEFDIKDWGINSIMYSVETVEVDCVGEDYETVEVNTEGFAMSIAPDTDNNVIQINNVDIDLYDETITIY